MRRRLSKAPTSASIPADGAVTVSGWATSISPGPSDESGQSVTFLGASRQSRFVRCATERFLSTGTLSFTPKAGAVGTATVSVQLMDNGGTANGGVDTSAVQQFTINLVPDLEGPVLDAALQNDTAPGGTTDFDGVTNDPTIAGTVFDPQGVASLTGAIDNGTPTPITVNSDNTFVYVPSLARDGSADGGHVVHLVALDAFGNESDFDVDFTLDTHRANRTQPDVVGGIERGGVRKRRMQAASICLVRPIRASRSRWWKPGRRRWPIASAISNSIRCR